MAKLTDQLVGKGEKPKLSPNPDGSGYIKQIEAAALSEIVHPEENVLYIIGDLKYKYLKAAIVEPGTNKVIVPAGFIRVGEAPNLALHKGEHGTPVKENQAPKQRPKVINEPVAFQNDVFYKGKLLEQQGGGGGGGNVSDLYLELAGEPTQAQLEQIYTQKPDVLRIGMGSSENVVVLYKSKQSEADSRLYYFNVQTSEGNVEVMKIEYSEEDGYIIEEYEWSLDGIVSGTNDGTNWTSLTINGETHGIPQGGGGSGTEEIYPIAIVATPSSTNIELAPAQNITLASMGEEAPGYTAAPYQTLNPVTYTKPYDAVLAEFGAGHQYLLPLISADSSMLLYGISEGSMPIFDADHPCAIMIQLNGSNIDSVMMISGGTYGPDGTLVATSLKGYFYSDEEFSFNASGIRDTDIAAAISAGKIPVAIINWRYKDFESWCPIKSFDEEDYCFEGEYKGNKFTLVCDGSYWRVNWLPVYVEDKQLAAEVDYANNKIYFRSLDAMRAMQSGLPMVKLELHDYTDVDKPLLGYLQLTLASQSDDKTECYYTSTQIENGDVKVTTIYVASGHTYASGSTITIVTLAPSVNP